MFLVLVFLFSSAASADIIIFKSGSAKIGIIEEETATHITIREKDKVATISKANIERVEYSDAEENEKLRMKWKEEKERLEEQRKKAREAEEKFEADQKAKGLLNVDGKWISVGEAEARRQEQIRQEVQQQNQSAAGTEPETSEEFEIPEYVEDLPEDKKELVLEELKRQQEIEVLNVQVVQLGGDQVQVKGTVINKSDTVAKAVELEIESFDEQGEVLELESARVSFLRPGESGSFTAPLKTSAELVKNASVRILSVRWE
jgi:hypothetical protein